MGSQVVTLSAPVFLVYSFSTSVLLLLIGVYQVWHTDVYLPRLCPPVILCAESPHQLPKLSVPFT